MGCKQKTKQTPQQRVERLATMRANLRRLYDRVKRLHGSERASRALLRHRLGQCARGSDCGRLCPELIKAHGKALVHCVKAGIDRSLYELLKDLDFECPKGFF